MHQSDLTSSISSSRLTRRRFVAGTAAAALGSSLPSAAAGEWQPKKAFLWSMLPGDLSVDDRFRLVRDVGFDGVEAPPIGDAAEAARMKAAAARAGVRIHSVIFGGWDAPLSHPDPAVRERGFHAAAAALESARNLGADDILLVPAIVDEQTRYVEAYRRSQEGIRRLIPIARHLGILILVEEVWNHFLLSPLEYAHYLDEFHSPWVASYFDVGNVVDFAWPQDWIRTVAHRIRRVHLKDYRRGPRQFVNLLEGDVNWRAVRQAFLDVGFNGFMTTELDGGDQAYLKDVSHRVDRIIAGV